MGEALNEKIVLEVSSPKPDLSGLAQLVEQLQAVDRYLGLINQKATAATSGAAMKRSAAQFASLAEGAPLKGKRKRDDLAAFFGFDQKDVEAFAANLGKTVREKMFESGQTFKSFKAAGDFFKRYADAAQAATAEAVNPLRAIFWGGGAPAPSATPKVSGVAQAATEGIVLQVPGSSIRAELVGTVELKVPAGSVSGSGGGGTGAAGGAAASGGSGPGGGTRPTGKRGKGTPGALGDAFEPAAGADEIRRRIERTEAGAKTAITRALGPLDTITKVLDENGGVTKETTELQPMRKRLAEIRRQVKLEMEAAKQAVSGAFTGDKGQDFRTKAGTLEQAKSNLLALAGQHEAALKAVGQEGVWIELRERAQTLGAQAEEARRKAARADLAGRDRELKAASASAKSADAEFRKREASRAKAAAEAEEMRRLAANQRATEMSAVKAEKLMADMVANQGFKVASEVSGGRTTAKGGYRQTRTVTVAKEEGNQKIARSFTFESDASGRTVSARMSETQRALKATREEAGAAGKDFLKNTAHVTTWAASVAVLYGALGIAQRSLAGLVETGYQTARLGQVFSGIGGTAADLRDSVLALGAANGRSADEAMEAATAWSRLGLSKSQVLEGVRQSLAAANVAEVTSIEATKALQAIMASYGLEVRHLGGVLGELNAISNTYNVTNKDLLDGISKAGGVAKQAGLPLAELAGYIGAVVGATGQSGSAVGNMVKSLGTGLGNPETQKLLRKGFDIEVRTDSGGEVKNLSRVLDELFVAYQKLTDAERSHLLYQVAGKTQASRVAALLDSYVRAQVLAINAQLNLNSAEKENAAIKGTLKAQLAGVATEWDRLVAKQGDRGFLQGAAAITQAFKNVLTVANAPGVSHGLTLFGGLLAALAARAAVTGIQLQAASGQSNFFANTLVRGRGALTAASAGMRAAFLDSLSLSRGFATMDSVSRGAAIRMYAFGKTLQTATAGTAMAGFGAGLGNAVKIMTGGLAVLRNFAGPIALIGGGIWAFNTGMEALGRSSEGAERALAGFNAEADRAGAAAGAAADAAKLFANAQKAMKDMRPADRRRMAAELEEVGKVAGGGKDSLGFTDEQAKEFRAAVATGDQVRQNALLQERYANAVRRGLEERHEEYKALQRGEEVLRKELERLQGAWFPSEAEIAKKTAELAQMRGKMTHHKIQSWEGVEDTRQANLDHDLQHQINLAKQKSLLESIVEIYKEMPAANPLERTKNEIAGIEEALRKNQQLQDVLKEEEKAGFVSEAARDREVEQIDKVIEAKQRAVTAAEKEAAAASSIPVYASSEAAGIYGPEALNAATEKRQKALADLQEWEARKRAVLERPTPDRDKNRDAQEKLEKEAEDLAKSKAAGQARLAIDRERSRREIAYEMAKAEGGQFEFGMDPTEKMLNKERGLRKLIAGKEQILDSGRGTEAERHNLVVQLLQHETDLYQTLIEKAKERFAITKEEAQLIADKTRESQRSMLLAGPAEMLKKMAAHRIAGSGPMDSGRWYALDPSIRKELEQLPQFSPEMGELQRRKRMLGTPPSLAQAQGGVDSHTAKMDLLRQQAGVTPGAGGAAVAAAREMNALAASATLTSGALQQLNTAIEQTIVNMALQSGQWVRNPQAGGHAPGRR